ncbi:MAG: hypothetical protein JWP75_2171 [Frondihabitans sp.]|nr:hypothetical protein [Frondihabitans sp.]
MSKYVRDPHVPPVHVQHLGNRHQNRSTEGDEPLQRESEAAETDAGPSYQDFLGHAGTEDDLKGETG